MTYDLYELVFEGLELALLPAMLEEIDSHIGTWDEVTRIIEDEGKFAEGFILMIPPNRPGPAIVGLRNLCYRILGYSGMVDLEVLWDHHWPDSSVIERLKEFAEDLSSRGYFEACYCGLDPASDEETRVFTINGPLRQQ